MRGHLNREAAAPDFHRCSQEYSCELMQPPLTVPHPRDVVGIVVKHRRSCVVGLRIEATARPEVKRRHARSGATRIQIGSFQRGRSGSIECIPGHCPSQQDQRAVTCAVGLHEGNLRSVQRWHRRSLNRAGSSPRAWNRGVVRPIGHRDSAAATRIEVVEGNNAGLPARALQSRTEDNEIRLGIAVAVCGGAVER